MKVFFSPQYNPIEKIKYEFENEKIKVTYNGITDIFDFSAMPDGKATDIETVLPFNPIISAERKKGVLYVKLIHFIGPDATENERFPDWQVIE